MKREARDEAKVDVSSRGGCAESLGMNVIYMGGFKNSQSTAEGAHLVVWENHHLPSITNSYEESRLASVRGL